MGCFPTLFLSKRVGKSRMTIRTDVSYFCSRLFKDTFTGKTLSLV